MALRLFFSSTRSQDWALKMLGFPTMLLSGFTCAILVLLAIMYEHHDEHWFAGILALGCSGFLAFVSIFSLVILRNPVEQVPCQCRYAFTV